jgi:timeless
MCLNDKFQDWEHRHEEHRLLIERLLILIRNILHVPTNPDDEMVNIFE